MIILDTCTLLWLAGDQKKLSKEAIKIIEKNADSLFVSSITAFEVAIKYYSKKIKLEIPPLEWFNRTLETHGIKEILVTSSIAIISTQLPFLHRDPCDRIIIATAQTNGFKILTPDKLIFQYKGIEVIW